jgi:hypothetical protein
MRKLALGLMATLCLMACASSGTSARSDSTRRRDSNLITQQELAASTARDAYQAVQMLRPDWFRRGRGANSQAQGSTQVVVYVDGQKYGTPRSLEQFRVGSFKELRYYNASEATNRWGTGHTAGVIYVSTR